MSRSYQEKVADFVQRLQPAIEADNKYYRELPIGSRLWSPCSGLRSRGIEKGHIGQVDTYAGNKQFIRGKWISREEALREGITLSSSHTICGDCSKVLREAE